jgi:hypothetical protein
LVESRIAPILWTMLRKFRVLAAPVLIGAILVAGWLLVSSLKTSVLIPPVPRFSPDGPAVVKNGVAVVVACGKKREFGAVESAPEPRTGTWGVERRGSATSIITTRRVGNSVMRVTSVRSVSIDMKMLLLGAVGMLGLQVLLVGGFFALGSQGPVLLHPDSKLDEDGITLAMLCGEGRTPEGRGSEVLSKMLPDGDIGAWSRGRTVRGNRDLWYHHNVLYNPHAHEACWVGCDYDFLERRLR